MFLFLPFGAILLTLFSIVGLGYAFLSSLSAIVNALSLVGLAILGIYEAGKQAVFAIKKNRYVWFFYGLISLIIGFFLPYYSYAFFFLVFQSVDIASFVGPFAALIIMIVVYSIDNYFMKEKNEDLKRLLIFCLVFFVFISITCIGAYGRWSKGKRISEVDKSISYIINEKCHPLVIEIDKYDGINANEDVRFPYWMSNVRYPFAVFKEGEVVYALKSEHNELYECVKRTKNGDGIYEHCFLVCDSKFNVVGYVPESKLTKK